MAALQCDICGGKLMGRPGGIFECDSCGMEYDTAWAKAKIQEIKGTVKVEGTVQVAGTVKIEDGISIQTLLRRGFDLIQDTYATKEAIELFDQVLERDPENGDAYVGLIMCRDKDRFSLQGVPLRTREQYRKALMSHVLDRQPHFKRMLQCHGSEQFQEELRCYLAMLAQEQKTAKSNAERGEAMAEHYASLREKYAPVRGMMTRNARYVLDWDGNVFEQQEKLPTPSDLIMIDGFYNLIMLDMAGNAYYLGATEPVFGGDIAQTLEAGCMGDLSMGLRSDGTIVYHGVSRITSSVRQWSGIKKLYSNNHGVLGIKKNGTFVWADIVLLQEDSMRLQKEGVVEGYGIDQTSWVFLKKNGIVEHSYLPGDGSQERIVDAWSDVIQISVHGSDVACLRADGTVDVAHRFIDSDITKIRDKVSKWKNIVAVSVFEKNVYGICKDGTLVATDDTCSPVRLFEHIDMLNQYLTQRRAQYQENQKLFAKKREEECIAQRRRDGGLCQHCGGEFKGLFTKKCVNCGKQKDY